MSKEITNADRAGWARKALNEYVDETRSMCASDYELTPDNKDNNEEVIGDFLSDLRHLCDELGIDWEGVDRSGAMHHREEVIEDLLAPDPWGQAEAADARKRGEFRPGQTVKLHNTHEGDGGWSTAYIESEVGGVYAVRVQGHSLYHVTADKLESLEENHA